MFLFLNKKKKGSSRDEPNFRSINTMTSQTWRIYGRLKKSPQPNTTKLKRFTDLRYENSSEISQKLHTCNQKSNIVMLMLSLC